VTTSLTAAEYIKRLKSHQSAIELAKIQRYFKSGEGEYGEGDAFIGVRMGQVFALSDEFKEMPLGEIETLLASPIHEVRAGGVKIMAKQAASKRTPESRRKELFELYLRSMDRINNWDLSSTWVPGRWSGATSSTSRATCSTTLPAHRTSGSAARLF